VRTNKSIREGKGEKIIELRNKGYSYDKIKNETGFSKSSISYHAGAGQKEKSLARLRKQNGGFKRKVWGFIYASRKPKNPFVYSTTELRKKGREFFYGDGRRISINNMIVEQPKIWQYWGKIFPGITSKTKEGKIQAVNQWTGELDHYDDGKPVMYPYARCKLTDDIYNVEGNNVHVDHADGNRMNNSIENFTFVINWANIAKGECKSYEEVKEKLTKILETIEKYK
jgi:hypothetical protein